MEAVVTTVGGLLIAADAVKGALLYRLVVRLALLERRVMHVEEAAGGDLSVLKLVNETAQVAAMNTASIDKLAAIVEQQGRYIVVSRELANSNYGAILAAVNAQQEATLEAIKKIVVPREVLQAQIADLYRRTAP